MKGLTDRQRQVLEFIATRIRETGYPPTIREIGEGLGIRSTNGVNDHLKALEKKGYITRDTSKSRAIMVTALADAEVGRTVLSARGASGSPEYVETLSVPLLGRIAAGLPIEAVADADEHVQLDPSLIRGRGKAPIFALRVSGDSMIGDGIFDGDIIFVRRQHEAARGEIVAVMVDGSATVKRYYHEGDRVRLEPSNPDMESIYVEAAEARDAVILGKVIGVYRQVG